MTRAALWRSGLFVALPLPFLLSGVASTLPEAWNEDMAVDPDLWLLAAVAVGAIGLTWLPIRPQWQVVMAIAYVPLMLVAVAMYGVAAECAIDHRACP